MRAGDGGISARDERHLRMVGEKKVNGIQYAEALAQCAGRCTLPTGLSGRGEVSCHDLLMALAKADVPELARRLVRWKYLDDPGESHETTRRLRDRSPHLSDALIAVAVWEWLSPAICLTCCGGRAQYAHLDVCPSCGGTGVPTRRQAPPAGLSVEAWDGLEPYFDRLLADLHDLTRLACIRAAALLTENEEIT